ncbi:MAG: DNA mismatch endonuclease Vsr [Chloroflexota bacterium]|jgi:DNA mismatch endonuclease (patch repair protein)
MKAVRHSGTKAELALRDALDQRGLIYETDARPIPEFARKADILFREERIAVFVDGCFWHGCPIHGTQAKSNVEFWRKKIEANQRRDEDTNRVLQENGWMVIRVWEHENTEEATRRIATLCRQTKRNKPSSRT